MTNTGAPFVAAALDEAARSFDDIRSCVAGAPPEALNWRPAGEDSNPIAVLAVHSMRSTRSWLRVALGAELPPRDRQAEFRAAADDAGALLAQIDEIASDCLALLHSDAPTDWSALRPTHARPDPASPQEVPAAWALVHAVMHLREHAGQLLLTRQLWDERAAVG